MPSLLDPLPEEAQQLVEIVAKTYNRNKVWPIWQYVTQQAFKRHGIDAEAALRSLPQWQGPQWFSGYQSIRMVPSAAGNSSPDIKARTVLTVHGLFHASNDGDHSLIRAFLKAIEMGANHQNGARVTPTQARPMLLSGAALAGVLAEQTATKLTARNLGLLLSGEPTTAGADISEADSWMWELARYRPLQPLVSPDARSYLIKFDALLGSQAPHTFSAIRPEDLPRALDHLNVVWKVVTQQRLFYPRGLASAASLVEPVMSGDQLTARLGALADIFDLFLRTATGSSPAGGSLNAFRNELVGHLTSSPAQDQARAAVGQLVDITRIRNGRLHTDASNWAESLHRLGVPASESPGEQWERIRALTVEAVYTIIELLQTLVL
jgi:hypothetical protein